METDLEVLGKKGLASASEETRLRVARKGGIAPHLRRGLEAETQIQEQGLQKQEEK